MYSFIRWNRYLTVGRSSYSNRLLTSRLPGIILRQSRIERGEECWRELGGTVATNPVDLHGDGPGLLVGIGESTPAEANSQAFYHVLLTGYSMAFYLLGQKGSVR